MTTDNPQSYFNDSKDAKNIWRFERLRQKGPVWSASYSNKGRRVELRNARKVQNVELESLTQSGDYGRIPLSYRDFLNVAVQWERCKRWPYLYLNETSGFQEM